MGLGMEVVWHYTGTKLYKSEVIVYLCSITFRLCVFYTVSQLAVQTNDICQSWRMSNFGENYVVARYYLTTVVKRRCLCSKTVSILSLILLSWTHLPNKN